MAAVAIAMAGGGSGDGGGVDDRGGGAVLFCLCYPSMCIKCTPSCVELEFCGHWSKFGNGLS